MDEFLHCAKAISDASRVRILKMLEPGELCVCHLTDQLGLAQSTVSKHLAVLRHAGLVSDRKDGLWVYYCLAEADPGTPQRAFLSLLAQSLRDDEDVLADRQALASPCCATVELAEVAE